MTALTVKNKQAIDLYLGPIKRFRGNGKACYREVYGSKSDHTARMGWSRMITKGAPKAYLEQRQREIEQVATERIAYEMEDAVRDLSRVLDNAMQHDEQGRMVDRRAAISAVIEILKVQGKYVTHSENVSVSVTTEDRMRAKVLGLGLNEYVKRKQDGTLPLLPESVTAH